MFRRDRGPGRSCPRSLPVASGRDRHPVPAHSSQRHDPHPDRGGGADPHPDSYQIAADLLAQIDVPIYYAVGNHDTAADIRNYMKMGPLEYLSDSLLTYRFDVKGQRFLVIDGRAPDEMDPQGLISDEQFAVIRDELENGAMPLTIFIHFPLFSMNVPWMDPAMLTSNGEELHKLLVSGRERINGVFFGHIHQHSQTFRDGLLYTSVASSFAQFSGWPSDEAFEFTAVTPPGYSFVQLVNQRMVVQQHTFERP